MPYGKKPSLVDVPQIGGDSAHVDSEKMKMQRLLFWLEEQGASFPSVKVEVGQGGREIHASRPIKSGSLVMHIPEFLFITTEAAKESEIGQMIASSNCDIEDSGYMAAHLIKMKRQGSFWSPYIDVLPKSFAEHPYFLTDSELEYLKGSYVLSLIRRRRKQLDYEYNQLLSCLPKEKVFTREEYLWGCCIYLTRTHAVKIAGVKTHALVPLADMPNHSISPNVLWGYESSRGFLYSAADSIEIDEPLTIKYWRECNGITWARFGFCLESNPYNVAEVQLPPILRGHPCFKYAKNLGVERNGMRVFRVPRDYDSSASHALFSYLRLSALTDLSGINIGKEWLENVPQIGRLSNKNEFEAMEALAIACRSALQKFDTSSAEDEAALKDSALALKLRNLIQVRHGEKTILNYYLDRAEAANTLHRDDLVEIHSPYPIPGEPEQKVSPASLPPVSRKEGWVIVLNGATCAGKSTLAKAILEMEATPTLLLSINQLHSALSSRYSTHKWPLYRELNRTLVASAQAASLEGMNVVIDTVLANRGRWREILALLSETRTYWVGLHAPLKQLLAREKQRGSGERALVKRQFETVHEGARYDIEVSTESTSPLLLARQILDYIQHAEIAREGNQARGRTGQTRNDF